MNRKDAYIEKANARIEEYSARLDVLKAKAREEVADQKISAHEHIVKLEAKLETAKSRLDELTAAAGDGWEDLSGRFEELADDLGASFRKFFAKRE